MKAYQFQAEILKHEGMDAAYISFPYDVEKEFGKKGQVKVKVLFDEKVEYRGSLAKMGLDCHCLGMTQKVRELIDKRPGDTVNVTLYQDNEPRIVEVPEDLNVQLQLHKLEETFLKLSYTKQKELVAKVIDSKKLETRITRITGIINSLRKSTDKEIF
jgi:hypothetical protein